MENDSLAAPMNADLRLHRMAAAGQVDQGLCWVFCSILADEGRPFAVGKEFAADCVGSDQCGLDVTDSLKAIELSEEGANECTPS